MCYNFLAILAVRKWHSRIAEAAWYHPCQSPAVFATRRHGFTAGCLGAFNGSHSDFPVLGELFLLTSISVLPGMGTIRFVNNCSSLLPTCVYQVSCHLKCVCVWARSRSLSLFEWWESAAKSQQRGWKIEQKKKEIRSMARVELWMPKVTPPMLI